MSSWARQTSSLSPSQGHRSGERGGLVDNVSDYGLKFRSSVTATGLSL